MPLKLRRQAPGAARMIKREPFSQAPDSLKRLISDLLENGDYLVYENERREPIVFISPLPSEAEARRLKAAARLREILASVPETSYTEEETVQHINEAMAAIRGQAQPAVS